MIEVTLEELRRHVAEGGDPNGFVPVDLCDGCPDCYRGVIPTPQGRVPCPGGAV